MPVPPYYAADPFLAIQHALVTPWLDGPMAFLTRACEGWAIGLIGVAWLAMAERARAGERAAALLRLWRVALPFVVGLVAVGLAVHGLKALADTPRPLFVYGAGHIHQLLDPLKHDGFPSGHSASVATFAAYATCHGGWRAWPTWVFALLGGLSRIYVGAHWTLDVVGGLAVGVAFGWAAHALARRAGLVPARP
jgi:undecaprenyl-diphosphatase